MPAIKIACPSCGTGLTFGSAPAPGTRVKCPRCTTNVAINGAAPRLAAPTGVRSGIPPTIQLEPAAPYLASRPRREDEGSSVKRLALVLVGFLLLLGVGIGVAALLGVGRKHSQVAQIPSGDEKPEPSNPRPEPSKPDQLAQPQELPLRVA
jgi:hypothetical protein